MKSKNFCLLVLSLPIASGYPLTWQWICIISYTSSDIRSDLAFVMRSQTMSSNQQKISYISCCRFFFLKRLIELPRKISSHSFLLKRNPTLWSVLIDSSLLLIQGDEKLDLLSITEVWFVAWTDYKVMSLSEISLIETTELSWVEISFWTLTQVLKNAVNEIFSFFNILIHQHTYTAVVLFPT